MEDEPSRQYKEAYGLHRIPNLNCGAKRPQLVISPKDTCNNVCRAPLDFRTQSGACPSSGSVFSCAPNFQFRIPCRQISSNLFDQIKPHQYSNWLRMKMVKALCFITAWISKHSIKQGRSPFYWRGNWTLEMRQMAYCSKEKTGPLSTNSPSCDPATWPHCLLEEQQTQ